MHWYSILVTFMFKLGAILLLTKICVLSNLSNCKFTIGQYKKSTSSWTARVRLFHAWAAWADPLLMKPHKR